MRTLFNRRFLRTATWAMLAVWLFAVSASVANACLLEESRTHRHASTSDGMPAEAGSVGAGHRVVRAAHDDDHREHLAAKAPCLKVCDETPQSPINQASSPGVDAPVLAAALWTPWHADAATAGVDARHVVAAGPATTGPPLRVIFSRLVL